MKLLKSIKLLLVLAMLFSITACDVEEDLCDSLVLNPSKNVSLVGKVIASASGTGGMIPIKVRFYKTACGQTEPKPGSTFTYSGIIERPFMLTYTSGTVNYELRSSDDYITAQLLVDEMNTGNFVIVYSEILFHEGLTTGGLNTINLIMN